MAQVLCEINTFFVNSTNAILILKILVTEQLCVSDVSRLVSDHQSAVLLVIILTFKKIIRKAAPQSSTFFLSFFVSHRESAPSSELPAALWLRICW